MGLHMSSQQQQYHYQETRETIIEDERKYECTLHSWRDIYLDFLDGVPEIPPWGERYFNIRTLLKERYCHVSNRQETHTNAVKYDFFNIPINSMKQATNYILSILNVPEENRASMAQQILDYAEYMADYTHKSFKTQFMIVMVDADILYHNNDNCYENTCMNEQAFQSKPACDNKLLKGVKLEQIKDWCPICLEDLRNDAVQMPCSHFFHGNCIVRWLLHKKSCPRCDFKMPTSDFWNSPTVHYAHPSQIQILISRHSFPSTADVDYHTPPRWVQR